MDKFRKFTTGAVIMASQLITRAAFAASNTEEIAADVQGVLMDIYIFLLEISLGLAVVVIAWQAIKMHIAANEREVQECQKAIKRVIVAFILVAAAPLIVYTLYGLVKKWIGGTNGYLHNVFNFRY